MGNSGITHSFSVHSLSDADGRLIAFNGGSESDAKALAAILDNIWFAYNRHGTPPTSSQDGSRDGLNTISLTNEVGLSTFSCGIQPSTDSFTIFIEVQNSCCSNRKVSSLYCV